MTSSAPNTSNPNSLKQQHLSSSSSCIRNTLILILLLLFTFYLILGHFMYHAMFSLSDKFYTEGYLKSRENSIFNVQTYINCSDWKHSIANSEFLQSLSHKLTTNQEQIEIKNVSFTSRVTPDIPYRVNLNGRFYRIIKHGSAASTGNTKKVIILVHGFRMRLNHYTIMVPLQMMLNAFPNGEYDFFTFEYRNHGQSDKEYPSIILPNKSYSTYGSLEYADLLGAIDFVKSQYGYEHVGLYGLSKGGATIMTAYLKSNPSDSIRAMFLDSPACDIEFTLQSNLYRVLGYLVGHNDKLELDSLRMKIARYLLWPAIEMVGSMLKPNHPHHSYPPFLNDAFRLWKTRVESTENGNTTHETFDKAAIHFDHPKSDILVPMQNSERCSALASKLDHLKVSTYYGDVNSKEQKHTFSECKDHCILMLSEPEQYYERMTRFFKENL
ncbi:hypothetical protein C9374_007108 [Naegleria lovaniensis]|uniref:AB hydrolase-1 domain-containing protein n=1 Tax=Naegleria lovaniensis TaxID=51637 RepID=A0AA88KRV7_NAELO|nr:uncharacterized protein C9374_007108 [Naegleria lovaniensis]KAG2393577.1 hypothetical protein C9374_007108 [Naegleria lovaniensis]